MSEKLTATRVLMGQWGTEEKELINRMRYLLEEIKKDAEQRLTEMDSGATFAFVGFLEVNTKELIAARVRLDIVRGMRTAMYAAQTHDAKD